MILLDQPERTFEEVLAAFDKAIEQETETKEMLFKAETGDLL